MAFFNYVTKEITLKVVYYGPGLSGKTTNLQHLYSALDPTARGKFISLATESDRTLFFDFLPVELGRIRDFAVRFQLYTVPGQIRYNATRKLVLKGADAVVFVADSQRDMREQNIESFTNMRENLISNNVNPDEITVVLQYNKRDLPNILSIDEMSKDLGGKGYQSVEAIAVNGKGVEETFRLVSKILLKDMLPKHKVELSPQTEEILSPMTPQQGGSSVNPVFSQATVEDKATDFVPLNREEIFPEAREEIMSMKTPDSAVFETNEAVRLPKAAEETGAGIFSREEKTILAAEKVASMKTLDKSRIEAEDFRARPNLAEPHGATAPPTAKPLTPPVYPGDKIDSVLKALPEIRQSLVGIKENLALLSSAMKESGKQQSDMV
ncbi:MAG TPA: GTPase domain-containing protein, partial [Thermodesulfovibrionales bacterium]|nr:GTPase domain-containing protein [Thermodesulfovibrionales bacterium]